MLHTLRHVLCTFLGYLLFMPPAIVTHLFWAAYGMLAWPLAKLGCDAKTIKEPYVLVVGPMYVSSKLWRNWFYAGCEPESWYRSYLKIHRGAFAIRWSQRTAENLKGNETKPLTPGAVVEIK